MNSSRTGIAGSIAWSLYVVVVTSTIMLERKFLSTVFREMDYAIIIAALVLVAIISIQVGKRTSPRVLGIMEFVSFMLVSYCWFTVFWFIPPDGEPLAMDLGHPAANYAFHLGLILLVLGVVPMFLIEDSLRRNAQVLQERLEGRVNHEFTNTGQISLEILVAGAVVAFFGFLATMFNDVPFLVPCAASLLAGVICGCFLKTPPAKQGVAANKGDFFLAARSVLLMACAAVFCFSTIRVEDGNTIAYLSLVGVGTAVYGAAGYLFSRRRRVGSCTFTFEPVIEVILVTTALVAQVFFTFNDELEIPSGAPPVIAGVVYGYLLARFLELGRGISYPAGARNISFKHWSMGSKIKITFLISSLVFAIISMVNIRPDSSDSILIYPAGALLAILALGGWAIDAWKTAMRGINSGVEPGRRATMQGATPASKEVDV